MMWIRITHAWNVPLREGRVVRLDGHEIALFNLGQRFLAVDNRCPHEGGPLADGIVSGNAVVCPLHGWKVCLESGKVRKPEVQACLETYPTKVEDGVVFIQITEAEESAA